jgi:hypothetical protein
MYYKRAIFYVIIIHKVILYRPSDPTWETASLDSPESLDSYNIIVRLEDCDILNKK